MGGCTSLTGLSWLRHHQSSILVSRGYRCSNVQVQVERPAETSENQQETGNWRIWELLSHFPGNLRNLLRPRFSLVPDDFSHPSALDGYSSFFVNHFIDHY